MRKRVFTTLATAAIVLGAAAAQATVAINFDPYGGSGTTTLTVGAFDWAPGNALGDNAVPIPTAPTTNSFNLYFQSLLTAFDDATGKPMTVAGLNDAGVTNYFEITTVAGFGELGSLSGNVATFGLDPSTQVNFYEIYWDDDLATRADMLAGTGFADGTLIMSGFATANDTFFGVTGTTPVPLDNFGTDNYVGVGTVTGVGGGALTATIDPTQTDNAYFLETPDTIIFQMLFNTSNLTPFSQTDPSAQFYDGTAVPVIPERGAATADFPNGVNGVFGGEASDFQFQADANSSFEVVPEPGTMVLLGSGLLGLAGLGRRRTGKKA